MKIKLLFFCVVVFLQSSNGQTPANDPTWNITTPKFTDDFTTYPGSPKWGVVNDVESYEHYAWFRSQNVVDSSGIVQLWTKRENYTVGGNSHNYTCGEIRTTNYLYGYFEIRCQTTWGMPTWDAFWMVDGDRAICNYSELDVFELNGDNFNYYSSNSHVSPIWNASPCNAQLIDNQMESENFPTNLSGYHIWGFEWSPNLLIWYLDGVEIRRNQNDLFTHQMQVRLNSNVRNNTTQNQSIAFNIDYIHIYGLNKSNSNCSSLQDVTLSTFSGYTYNLKHNISIGNNVSVPSSSTVILRASNEITIGTDFTVPLGSEFGALITPCY